MKNDYFNQQSERLKYRKLSLDDIPSWVEFFEDNDRLHFFGISNHETDNLQHSETWVKKQLKRYTEEYGLLAVLLKSTNELIGMGGVLPREINGVKEYEIAYSLKPKFWKLGYGTEMANHMKQYALENIKPKRLISMIDKDNLDSIKVAKKNGMKFLFESEYLEVPINVYGTQDF